MSQSAANTIILVEDEDALARLMSFCLTAAGFAVERIADGRSALELVKREALPALVIIDYLMPYADGLRVTRCLRDHAQWQVVPIICITSTTHEDTMIQGLRLHSDGFLTKPFRPEELVMLARRLTLTAVRESAAGTLPDPTT